MDISEAINFRDVCMILEKVKNAQNAQKKEDYLRRWYGSFQNYRKEFRHSMNITESDAEDGRTSFYCALRCLIPGADNARPAYGLQITTLGKEYIKILQLSDQSPDAHRLRANTYTGVHGDYADIVYGVLKSRCRKESSSLKLKEVHEMLDAIAKGDRRNTEKILTVLFEVASAQEQLWFIRLLLKSMRLGVGEQRIFGILHPQAKELYQRCSNLSRVCCLLANNDFSMVPSIAEEDGDVKPNFNLNLAIKPFEHIRPMLCELFPGNIEKLLESDVLFLETKMDGERFQLHFDGGKFKYISRKGIDYTVSFGEDYSSGNLTPHLSELLPIGMESIILDGEMMIWDEKQQRYREKTENTDVKHLSGNSSWKPCFVLYDLLYFNGHSLLDMPYIQRTIKLNELIKEKPGVLCIMTAKKVSSIENFREMFQEALNKNEEGVVLKKQTSPYRPGVRNGGGWYKIKADYIDGLTTEFDLLIIGGFYNRTRTFIESFLLGVLKYTSPLQFQVFSVCKVKNITSRRVVLNDTLKPYWHQLDKEPPPLWYHYVSNNAEGRPDVWIEPRNSEVLQIKATDLNPSAVFSLPKSLHFPRIQCWRNDKVWNECMSLEEYTEMIQDQSEIKKINKRELSLEDLMGDQKRAKMTPAQKRKQAIESYEKRFDETKVEPASNILAGYTFCMLSGCYKEGHTPESLKAMVVRHGGEIVENPIAKTAKCIAVEGVRTVRVESLIKSGRYNIVSLEWLLKTCESGKVVLKPTDMIAMTAELEEEFKTSNIMDNEDEEESANTQVMSANELNQNANAANAPLPSSGTMSNNGTMPLGNSDERILEMFDIICANLKIKNPHFFCHHNAVFYGEELYTKGAKFLFEWRGGNIVELKEGATEAPKVAFIFYSFSQKCGPVEFGFWLKQHFENQLREIQILHIGFIIKSHIIGKKLKEENFKKIGFE